MEKKGVVIEVAQEFVYKSGFKYPVLSNLDKEFKRMAAYDMNKYSIIVKPARIYQAHRRFNLNLKDYVNILIARELGRAIDTGLVQRREQIDKTFQVINKGFYSEQVKQYLINLVEEEELEANKNGRKFINKDLEKQYDFIGERYVFLETESVQSKALIANLRSKLNNSIEESIAEIL